MLELLSTILNPDSVKGVLDILTEQGLITKLIERIDKESIDTICLTLMYLKTDDTSIQKVIIETIRAGKIPPIA